MRHYESAILNKNIRQLDISKPSSDVLVSKQQHSSGSHMDRHIDRVDGSFNIPDYDLTSPYVPTMPLQASVDAPSGRRRYGSPRIDTSTDNEMIARVSLLNSMMPPFMSKEPQIPAENHPSNSSRLNNPTSPSLTELASNSVYDNYYEDNEHSRSSSNIHDPIVHSQSPIMSQNYLNKVHDFHEEELKLNYPQSIDQVSTLEDNSEQYAWSDTNPQESYHNGCYVEDQHPSNITAAIAVRNKWYYDSYSADQMPSDESKNIPANVHPNANTSALLSSYRALNELSKDNKPLMPEPSQNKLLANSIIGEFHELMHEIRTEPVQITNKKDYLHSDKLSNQFPSPAGAPSLNSNTSRQMVSKDNFPSNITLDGSENENKKLLHEVIHNAFKSSGGSINSNNNGGSKTQSPSSNSSHDDIATQIKNDMRKVTNLYVFGSSTRSTNSLTGGATGTGNGSLGISHSTPSGSVNSNSVNREQAIMDETNDSVLMEDDSLDDIYMDTVESAPQPSTNSVAVKAHNILSSSDNMRNKHHNAMSKSETGISTNAVIDSSSDKSTSSQNSGDEVNKESYLSTIAYLHQSQNDLNSTITQLRSQLKEQQLQFEMQIMNQEVSNVE